MKLIQRLPYLAPLVGRSRRELVRLAACPQTRTEISTRPGAAKPTSRLPVLLGCALFLFGATAAAQDFPPERIRAGAAIFSRNCSPCHGTRMQNPESAFDLRKFPPDQYERFVSSVTHGKNQMPPWGDLLSAEEIESLWAYVMAGEPK